ncbi:MAG: hypothetical protein AB1490_24400 [Pseudomonadota bacterium]
MKLRFGIMTFTVAASATLGSLAYAAGVNVDAIAGVYKQQFKNGLVDGSKYDSEDILEIVKVSPTSAYVRAHYEFFNGHECNINGVAKADGDVLVYRGDTDSQGKQCLLSVKVSGGKIMLDDKDGVCGRETCGARGMYNGKSFALSKKRAIRYMDKLKKSDEYLDAIDESEGKGRSRAP